MGTEPETRTRSDLTFYAVVALLLAHELDAVARHEWRLLPVLRGLPDATAVRLFVALHVPVVVASFQFASHPSESLRVRFQLGVDAFAVVHVGLHALFAHHPDYEFDGPLSKLWIRGAGAVGVAHAISLVDSIRRGR